MQRHTVTCVTGVQPKASPRRLQHCRRDGFPRSYQRTPAGNRTTARGGCPGSRVVARVPLPKAPGLSGFMDVRSPVTVAGAAAVSHRVPI
jgi:hypothetical protein